MFKINGMKQILRAPEGDAGGDAAAVAAAAAAAAAAKPWYEPLDADTKGYLTTKGLDKKTAVEAFAEAAKSHREAEKFVGAPANEMVRLPKEANAPEWEGVHQRLGKPKDKAEYDFATVKRAGDVALDAAFVDAMKDAAFAANMTKDAATRFVADVVKTQDAVTAASDALKADKLTAEKTELKKNWGANEAANLVIARSAAAALGVPPEGVAALEGIIGYAKVMEMFRDIGTKIGEDRFVTAGGQKGNVMTRDQAVSQKNAHKNDKAWVTRFLAGGVEEKRTMDALDRIILGMA